MNRNEISNLDNYKFNNKLALQVKKAKLTKIDGDNHGASEAYANELIADEVWMQEYRKRLEKR